MGKRKNAVSALITAAAVLLTGLAVKHLKTDSDPGASGLKAPCVRCILELGSYNDTSAALITGYSYRLIKDFAAREGVNLSVELTSCEGTALDSLRKGRADIVVLPWNENFLQPDSVLVSLPVDSLTVWVVREGWNGELAQMNRWIEGIPGREGHARVRDTFMKVYSPFRSRQRKDISPYDSLVRLAADTLGWDWRLLSAVIYKESHFHIEARSHRGARGLMQMMPSTAATFGADDLLDHGQSISAGARYLGNLSRRYAGLAADPLERQKYTLAAYNAGAGRIKDCIEYARYKGIEPERWDQIVELIPEMRDSSILDVEAVRLGIFKGYETIDYVNSVLAVYDEFRRIHPGK